MRPIKKGQNGNPDSKPGKAKQILFENLSSLPGTVCDVLNGHVLFLFLYSFECSRAMTVKKLNMIMSTSVEPESEVDRRLQAEVKKLVRTFEKLKKLSNPLEFHKFDSMCHEAFSFPVLAQVVSEQFMSTSHASEPEPSSYTGTAESMEMEPAISPVKKTRKISSCESCKRQKKCLQSMRQRQLKCKERSL